MSTPIGVSGPEGIELLDASGAARGGSAAPLYIQLTNAKQRVLERLVPPAPGATIHASIAAGAALAVTTAFTQIFPPTNVRLSRGGAGAATVYTASGTRLGVAQTETIASNGASDVEGVKVFDTITSLTSDVDPTVTTTVKTGVILGTQNVFDSILGLFVGANGANGVKEAVTMTATMDGFTPTTSPDASKVFQVLYQVLPTTTQP